MVPEPAPVPTRRPLAAGSAASDATQRAAAADTANAAIRAPRAIAARPRAPRNMRRLRPPAVPPFAAVPSVDRSWLMLAIMGLGNRCTPSENDSFEKRRRLVLSRHTLGKTRVNSA